MRTDRTFSVPEALRYGWESFKRNLGLSIGIMVAGALAVLILNGLTQAAHRLAGLVLVLSILSGLVRALWGLVGIRFALAVHDGRPVRARELVPDGRTFLNYLAVSILYGLAVGVGLLLLIVPGIYVAVRFGFAGFLAADGRADVIDAFRKSFALTRGETGPLLLLALALMAVNLVGAIAFGVGLLVTIPLSVFALALVYRRLAARLEHDQVFMTSSGPLPA